ARSFAGPSGTLRQSEQNRTGVTERGSVPLSRGTPAEESTDDRVRSRPVGGFTCGERSVSHQTPRAVWDPARLQRGGEAEQSAGILRITHTQETGVRSMLA